MIYGERGRRHIDIHIHTPVTNYWLSIVNGKPNKLCYKWYSSIYAMLNENKYTSPWLHFVKRILDGAGLSNTWLTQSRDISKQ